MPFEVKRINPIDRQPRKAVGIKLPFSGDAVFNLNFTTKDSIKTNIINFFLTGRGERFFNVGFGTGLRNLLFENINDEGIEKIDAEVRRSLRENFPTVIPIKVETVPDSDNNRVDFRLIYEIAQTGIQDELAINFVQ